MERIIKLVALDRIGPFPDTSEKFYDDITVIRADYSKELMAYFVRSKAGVLLIVNASLTAQEQAKAISIIKTSIEKCGIAETGVLNKDFKFFCGGTCCNGKERNVM